MNSNFHLIWRKSLLTNDFELTMPDLYMKIRLKALDYFELQQTLKYQFELDTSNKTQVNCPSNYWNFELTMFELTMHFKHEMIGIWQRYHRNFELSGTSN